MKALFSSLFEEALIYTARLHASQRRKGKDTPYIAHLMAVSALVLEYGGSETQAIAALLHDAAEDQGGRTQLEEIRRRFGDDVARIVADCTDSWTVPKPPWRARKEAYLQHIAALSPDSYLVSLADKVNNANTILQDHYQIGNAVWERFAGGKEGSLWYYRCLVDTFRECWSSPLIDELDRIVTRLEELSRVRQRHHS